jgi:hypothetical protein
MNIITKYIKYLRDNPEGYWFKRKLYGWGWTPAKWQGWLVILVALAFLFFGLYVGQTDDAPGAALLGFLIMVGIIFYFGYKKGEKPRWPALRRRLRRGEQWGEKKE